MVVEKTEEVVTSAGLAGPVAVVDSAAAELVAGLAAGPVAAAVVVGVAVGPVAAAVGAPVAHVVVLAVAVDVVANAEVEVVEAGNLEALIFAVLADRLVALAHVVGGAVEDENQEDTDVAGMEEVVAAQDGSGAFAFPPPQGCR